MATVKVNDPPVPPTMSSPVVTVTTSPGLNGTEGTKLPPIPSESASTEPVCLPLAEPVTTIDPSRLGGTPRNVICVPGAATRPPGTGNTLTGADCAREAGTVHGAATRIVPNATQEATRTTKLVRLRSGLRDIILCSATCPYQLKVAPHGETRRRRLPRSRRLPSTRTYPT